jgi:hypothetical protein
MRHYRLSKRKGWIEDGIGHIPLTQGQVVFVDAEDVESLSQWKWYAAWNKTTQSYYAQRSRWVPETDTLETILMHRFILGLEANDLRTGDHHDVNSLNNQKHNLRIATDAEQARNQKLRKTNKSGFKGVCKINENRYVAHITFNRKTIYLGVRNTAEEASELYSVAAEKYHGAFARLV